MATGVEPRDGDFEFTRDDLDRLSDALKKKEFRQLLADYCDEMTDPAKQAIYQKEMTQLEKERGMDIVFINPEPGYVIKTSVAGEKKAFINICSNPNIGKPQYFARNGGMQWQIPYSLSNPHEDHDKKRAICVVYDVVFHPNSLEFSEKLWRFKKLVIKTACDALESNFSIVLDKKNVRFPKMKYKGHPVPTVIRTPDPNFKPNEPESEKDAALIDKLYPQKCHPIKKVESIRKPTNSDIRKPTDESPYTIPKYIVKQQRDVDMQEFTFDKNSKQHCTIPKRIVVQINLPLISSTADCQLDVKEKSLSLICEKPAKYKLDLTLPYRVNDDCGSAKFDKTKRVLVVTLPIIKDAYLTEHQKQDSGVETDTSDDEKTTNLITEVETSEIQSELPFLDRNLSYALPSYTVNSMDDLIAVTLHVKNVEPGSVSVKRLPEERAAHLKFTSIGTGYVPSHYAAYVSFPDGFSYEGVSAEAWDNNVIVQFQMRAVPDHCSIGFDRHSLNVEKFDSIPVVAEKLEPSEKPVIEVLVTNSDEVSIAVTPSHPEEKNEARDIPKPPIPDHCMSGNSGSGSYKGILRYPSRMGRSLSESSVDFRDFSSSIDCVSSDCIPEESSLKKTVRFNDVIAKQVFRSNSSILGQKKKNQRKSRNKKKSLERRLSESEPDEPMQSINRSKGTPKKGKHDLKPNQDSGLSETSDGENRPPTENSDKHSKKFYDPDKLNKGRYLEVAFKNDLIFDLDM